LDTENNTFKQLVNRLRTDALVTATYLWATWRVVKDLVHLALKSCIICFQLPAVRDC